jgi:hypothetical protein
MTKEKKEIVINLRVPLSLAQEINLIIQADPEMDRSTYIRNALRNSLKYKGEFFNGHFRFAQQGALNGSGNRRNSGRQSAHDLSFFAAR